MHGHGMGADDNEPGSGGQQKPEQIEEILVHRAITSLVTMRRGRAFGPGQLGARSPACHSP